MWWGGEQVESVMGGGLEKQTEKKTSINNGVEKFLLTLAFPCVGKCQPQGENDGEEQDVGALFLDPAGEGHVQRLGLHLPFVVSASSGGTLLLLRNLVLLACHVNKGTFMCAVFKRNNI